MNRIAKFEKVPELQFINDYVEAFDLDVNEPRTIGMLKGIYRNIKLPQRATQGSAGYDFYAPEEYHLNRGDTIKIPTGIRVSMDPSYVLMIFPRSGWGFKYRLQLDNTVGIIDSDYYFSDNSGHIHIKISKDSYDYNKLIIPSGAGFAQGIFVPFGITLDDNVTENRNGGFGSTTKSEPPAN